MPIIIGICVIFAIFVAIGVALIYFILKAIRRPASRVTLEAFVSLAAERGVALRASCFEAVQVESGQGVALVDLAEEVGVFVLGIEGFMRLGDGGFRPNLAWIFDTSKEYESAAPREAARRARQFLETVPKTGQVFLEFVLVPPES